MSKDGEYEKGQNEQLKDEEQKKFKDKLNSQIEEEGKKAYDSVQEYFEKINLLTILEKGLMEIDKNRPDDPVEALGKYLIKSEEGKYDIGLNSQLNDEGQKVYQSVRDYLEKHKLSTILQEELKNIEEQRPDNPVEFLGNLLINKSKK